MHNSQSKAANQEGTRLVLWVALLFFAAAVILPIFPQTFPRPVLAAAQIIPAVLFALVHGSRIYRWRGILVFALISVVVGFAIEVLGVRTGFPFGHYYFTDGMGPKLFLVPILMGPAYLGMGYVSWTVARAIMDSGNGETPPPGPRLITLPLAASFVMVAWDLSLDPALSTHGRYWIWTQGGAYFGVPVSNFLGWYLTNYLIYQLFALHLRGRSATLNFAPLINAHLAVLFYAVCAAGAVLRASSPPSAAVVADPSGTLWRVADLNNACALAAIFIMGAFVLLAIARLTGGASGRPIAAPGQWNDSKEATETFVEQSKLERVP
jgi:putative membrane protein